MIAVPILGFSEPNLKQYAITLSHKTPRTRRSFFKHLLLNHWPILMKLGRDIPLVKLYQSCLTHSQTITPFDAPGKQAS